MDGDIKTVMVHDGNEGQGGSALVPADSSSQDPPVTTTLSTIAVQAGKARIIIALLQNAEWVKLKILEMDPELTKIGSSLDEAVELQKQHEEVLVKLQGKQSPVEELLNQADQLISTQKPKAEVYAAMAESLGQAWRDLNGQLEIRKQLLDMSVAFHSRAHEFSSRMDRAEKEFTDTVLPNDAEIIKKLLQQHHDMKKGILEASMYTLNESQPLLEKLRELANEGTRDSRPNNTLQATNAAISQIEYYLERLHDRRRHLEDMWSKRKILLEQCLQLCLLNHDLQQVQQWLQTKGAELLRTTNLGDSSASAEILQHEHSKYENESKEQQDRALRLLKTAEQLCNAGHFAGEDARNQTYSTLEQCTDVMSHVDNRHDLLSMSVSFFRSAQTALTKLDQIDVQLATMDLPRNSAALAQQHAQLSNAIQEITAPALHEGHTLLERVNRNDPGTFGVARTVTELEQRRAKLDSLCTAHHAENLERSAALNTFHQNFTSMYTWIVQIGEAFLQGHQDMGSVLAMAKDFLNAHEHLQNDVRNKGTEIEALMKNVPNLIQSSDPDSMEVQQKSEDLRIHWLQLRTMLDVRIRISQVYVKFHRLSVQLATDMDNIEQMLRTEDSGSEAAKRNVDESWLSMQQQWLQLAHTGKNFIQDANDVVDPYLDIKRAILCVETLLEHFQKRQENLANLRDSWHHRITAGKEFRSQWEQFVQTAKQTIDNVKKTENDMYPIMRSDSVTAQALFWELERINENMGINLKKLLADIDNKIKTAENLSMKGDTQGQHEHLINELLKIQQQFQISASDFQILLSMITAYFRNVMELEKMIEKLEIQYNTCLMPSELPHVEQLLREHEASKQTVTELFRFTSNDGEQIINKIKQQEPPQISHVDADKITRIVQLRLQHWEKTWENHRRTLEQHLQLCQFNKDLKQINTHIDELTVQLTSMKGNYGESWTAAKATSQAFIQFEKTIELLEQRIRIFVSTAEKMLLDQHYDSHHIRFEIEQLQTKWSTMHRQVGDSRYLIDLSIDYFKIVEEAEEWFKEGSKLLISIARKSTTCRTPQDATNLLNEVEIFLKPGEAKQEERLRKISSMAVKLYGDLTPIKMEAVSSKNREMLESFTVINEELSTLAINLKTAEQQRLKQQKEKEEVDATLAAAKAEAAAAKAAAAAAEEARKAAEAAARAIPVVPVQIQRVEVIKQEALPIPPSPPKIPPKQPEKLVKEEPPLVPPSFVVPLKNVEVMEGIRFKFECKVTGFPIPDIQWYKDGIPISNNPDYQTQYFNGICSLTIEETFSEDSSRFTCRAVNCVGIAETQGHLTVIESQPHEELSPPDFIRKLESAVVKEKQAFQFECQVIGNPLPLVSWFKNDVCIDNSPDYVITYNNGVCILRFEEIFRDDDARYTCKASNQVGQATCVAKLSVQPLEPMTAPSFLLPLSNVMARAGQKIRLECQVTGIPQPQISWLHNHKPVKETGDIKMQFNGSQSILTINEAFPKDAGMYVVVAKNPAGEAVSSCNVSVKGRLPLETSDSELPSDLEPVKPQILEGLKDIHIVEGSKVRMDCIIVGQPEPEVIWYHNGKPVKESNDFQLLFEGDKCSLVIKEAYLEDAGDYRVVAINSAGEASSACRLTVEALSEVSDIERSRKDIILSVEKALPPKFIKLLIDTNVNEGDLVKLETQVVGDPEPFITWFKDNKEVGSNNDYNITRNRNGITVLTIPEVFAEDAGTYMVKATNKAGEAKCFCNLTVKPTVVCKELPKPSFTKTIAVDISTPPFFKKLFTDTHVLTKRPVRFECEITGIPKPKVCSHSIMIS